jgi:uncharacterized protein YneF (UPF0154 family)
LKNTNSLPQYQGPLMGIEQACITAPQPKLKDASHLSTNTSESIMEWPTIFDTYYSNCANSLYCDKANICVNQLQHGEVCESDNQCLNGGCIQNTCQQLSTNNSNNNNNNNISGGLSTIHIILTVVGIVLFLGLLFGIYMLRRYRNNIKKQINQNDKLTREEKTISTSSAASSTTSTSSNHQHHNVTNILSSPDYDPQHQNSTPSRQQQQLQLELVRQMNPPPPPYSP